MDKKKIIDELRMECARQNYDRVRADVLAGRYLRLSTAYGEALLSYMELLGEKVKPDAVRDVIRYARDAGDKVHGSLNDLIAELRRAKDDLAVKLEVMDALIEQINRKEEEEKQ